MYQSPIQLSFNNPSNRNFHKKFQSQEDFFEIFIMYYYIADVNFKSEKLWIKRF